MERGYDDPARLEKRMARGRKTTRKIVTTMSTDVKKGTKEEEGILGEMGYGSAAERASRCVQIFVPKMDIVFFGRSLLEDDDGAGDEDGGDMEDDLMRVSSCSERVRSFAWTSKISTFMTWMFWLAWARSVRRVSS